MQPTLKTMIKDWKQCASVTPGGKPFFYVRSLTAYHGYQRIVWDRRVLAYAATIDQKYGDRPTLVGYYSTVNEAKQALSAS